MMHVKGVWPQWFINYLIKKTSGGAVKIENMSNQELAEQLHKPITKKIDKLKVYPPFIDNIWSDDLADT